MIRARFLANYHDWRPVHFPPPGPAWLSGHNGDETNSVVVGYFEDEDQIKWFWPEARRIEYLEVDQIVFNDRFPRPVWWPEGKLSISGRGPVPEDGARAYDEGFKLKDNPYKTALARRHWSIQFKEQEALVGPWDREGEDDA